MADFSNSISAPVHQTESAAAPRRYRHNHRAIMSAAHFTARWRKTGYGAPAKRPYIELLREALKREWAKCRREIAMAKARDAERTAEKAEGIAPPAKPKTRLFTRETGRLAASFAN